jgi:hypothetical protein
MSYATTIIADAVADAIHSGVDYLTRPKTDPALQFLTTVLPMVPGIVQALKPPVPVDNDGPTVQQVKRELAAEEAHLRALFAERRARLLADFVPRFEAARAADDTHADEDSQSLGDAVTEAAAVAAAVGETIEAMRQRVANAADAVGAAQK